MQTTNCIKCGGVVSFQGNGGWAGSITWCSCPRGTFSAVGMPEPKQELERWIDIYVNSKALEYQTYTRIVLNEMLLEVKRLQLYKP